MSEPARIIYGAGIMDADYPVFRSERINGKRKVIWRCPFYRAWADMLMRCYSERFLKKWTTYAGCTVEKEWLTFSKFKSWMEAQDWTGKHLDKDVLEAGNKVYSADSCIFIGSNLNQFLTNSAGSRGEYPIGVNWHKSTGKFVAKCSNPFTGKRESLGYFSVPEVAHEAWRKRKHELACQYADMQTDPRVANALRERFATPTEQGSAR